MSKSNDLDRLDNMFTILSNKSGSLVSNCVNSLAKDIKNRVGYHYEDFKSKISGDPQHRRLYIKTFDTSNGAVIILTGNQLLYDEFGTGQNGENNPHPLHEIYGMNAYGSGPSIKEDDTGNKYWFYRNALTYGVPAGKFIYNTMRELENGVADKIVKKEILEAIRMAKKG